MGPPKSMAVKKRKQKRDYVDHHSQNHSQSMPTTPNLENRASHAAQVDDPEGSDSDYGFSNRWGN